MLGAIIGDIVGSRWEFNPTNDYNFEWLSDENGFTDDTICTVAVADATGGVSFSSHPSAGIGCFQSQKFHTTGGTGMGGT
jgi:hypothetical protein